MRIVMATQNPNKVREFAEILEGRVELVPLPSGLPKAPETGETFLENARQKALFYATYVEDPVLAEILGLWCLRSVENRAYTRRAMQVKAPMIAPTTTSSSERFGRGGFGKLKLGSPARSFWPARSG